MLCCRSFSLRKYKRAYCVSPPYFYLAVLYLVKTESNAVLATESVTSSVVFFCGGEGPCSRRYGRTAALRLIVQPYDENDYYFLSFS
jgi:uncharacterized membrane protein